MPERRTDTSREVEAGCFDCQGDAVIWRGGNAQGVAARHHDTTRHATWVRIDMRVQYGTRSADDRQHDIEDAIAASSGDAPECAPLPDLDAPAVTAACVSVPVGRPVETQRPKARAARGRKPEVLHA